MKLSDHARKSIYRPLGFQMSPRRLSDGGRRSQGTVGADTVSLYVSEKVGALPWWGAWDSLPGLQGAQGTSEADEAPGSV